MSGRTRSAATPLPPRRSCTPSDGAASSSSGSRSRASSPCCRSSTTGRRMPRASSRTSSAPSTRRTRRLEPDAAPGRGHGLRLGRSRRRSPRRSRNAPWAFSPWLVLQARLLPFLGGVARRTRSRSPHDRRDPRPTGRRDDRSVGRRRASTASSASASAVRRAHGDDYGDSGRPLATPRPAASACVPRSCSPRTARSPARSTGVVDAPRRGVRAAAHGLPHPRRRDRPRPRASRRAERRRPVRARRRRRAGSSRRVRTTTARHPRFSPATC